jgi:hypothetical protein
VSAPIETQQRVDAFLRDFLQPLLAGGTARLGRALGPSHLDAATLATGSDASVEHALHATLAASASELLPPRAVRWPDRGAVALALAAHDLALLGDPLLDRAFARGARAVLAGFVRALLGHAGPVHTRDTALVRHAIVGQARQLVRTDVTVRNWAYTEHFQGRPVPPRFTAWRTLRRVRTSAQTLSLRETLTALPPELGAPALFDALVAASPLTYALTAAPASFRVDDALAPLLLDPALRGAIVRARLADDPIRAGECAGTALLALRDARPDAATPSRTRIALTFAYELQATALLGRGSPLPLASPEATAAAAAFAALVGSADGIALVGVDLLRTSDAYVLREAAIDARHRVGEDAFHAALAQVRVAAPPPTSIPDLSLAPEASP